MNKNHICLHNQCIIIICSFNFVQFIPVVSNKIRTKIITVYVSETDFPEMHICIYFFSLLIDFQKNEKHDVCIHDTCVRDRKRTKPYLFTQSMHVYALKRCTFRIPFNFKGIHDRRDSFPFDYISQTS